MIAAASADGSGNRRGRWRRLPLGDLLETSIGVFQILGTNSNESFSWGGTLNTSSKYKTAFVNVIRHRVRFKSPPAGGAEGLSIWVGGLDETRTRDPMRDRHVF